MRVKEESEKNWLKTQHSKNQDLEGEGGEGGGRADRDGEHI